MAGHLSSDASLNRLVVTGVQFGSWPALLACQLVRWHLVCATGKPIRSGGRTKEKGTAMNAETQAALDSLVNDFPETEREKAGGILRSCQFQDANDPMLGLLRLLQLRETNLRAKERPLAASVATLGEDLANHVWEAKQLKLAFFFACVLMAFVFGLGIGYYPAATAPKTTTDTRLQLLQEAGVKFRVEEIDQSTGVGVGLTGDWVATEKKGGETLLYFRKKNVQ